jgi:predicted nucleotidyltransferase
MEVGKYLPNSKIGSYDYSHAPERVRAFLGKVVDDFKSILRENLVGVYLHGSLAMGGFVPGQSDVDVMVVAENALSDAQKESLAKSCLSLSKEIDGKGLEISVILRRYAEHPVYPMPFEFHYSETWRSKFENGQIGPFPNRDPDLSAHLRVISERGITLFGKPINKVFGAISDEDYLKALLYDLEDIQKSLMNNPVYYILNLCRIMAFIQTRKVMSKKEGGEWYLANEKAFKKLVKQALKCYLLNLKPNFDSDELKEFAKYALQKLGCCFQAGPNS